MGRWAYLVARCVRDPRAKMSPTSRDAYAFVPCLVLIFLAWVFPPGRAEATQAQAVTDWSIPGVRALHVERLGVVNRAARQEAEVWARAHGFPIRYDDGVRIFGLMYLRNNRPVYYVTQNVNAAITTAADKVRNVAPYYLDGSGLTVGLWDLDGILATHQEFGSRVRIMDGDYPPADHATHVAGTIGAAGVDPLALGMAPGVKIDYYDADADVPEMAQRGASFPGEQDTICASNHSYGPGSGWEYTNLGGGWGWHWWSDVWNGPKSKAELFGQYDREAQQWDEIAYGAPYYLIFTSAGNDRTDNPTPQQSIYYLDGEPLRWQRIPYNLSTCPPGDGVAKGGYDTIASRAVAKNVMTVGSVADAVSREGQRYLPYARMSVFSSWGPADDGRIKPDIVANGEHLYSCIAVSRSAYSDLYPNGFSGTSMSSPNACGSAVLLVQYYNELFPGQAMRSSTLKGLIFHTADDLGNPGPDYSFGWGLMNTEAAVALIKQHFDNPTANRIVEADLHARQRVRNYHIDVKGSSPVRVTLCWTDPPASAIFDLDDASPRLVNDLDLRVIGPDGSVFYPFVLDPNNPSAPATTGDNTLDNAEQVLIESPSSSSYTIEVSYKGTLTNDEQYFSLIVSGISAVGAPPAPSDPVPPDGATDVPVDTTLSWNGDDVIVQADPQGDPAIWATWYVFLGKSADALDLVCEGLSEPIFDPGILDYATTYYWQVIAKNDNGLAYSPVWSFTTESSQEFLNAMRH